MELEPKVVLLPLMPQGVFFALQHAMHTYPLPARFRVGVDDLVTEGEVLVTFKHRSVVAPFPGRIVQRSIFLHCGPNDWLAGRKFPGMHAYDVARHVSIGIQPARGANTQDAVNRAYAEIIQEVRDTVSPPVRNLWERWFPRRARPGVAEEAEWILSQLAALSTAHALVAPMGVDIDDYFGGL